MKRSTLAAIALLAVPTAHAQNTPQTASTFIRALNLPVEQDVRRMEVDVNRQQVTLIVLDSLDASLSRLEAAFDQYEAERVQTAALVQSLRSENATLLAENARLSAAVANERGRLARLLDALLGRFRR